MRSAWVWAGFTALLVIGVVSGYAPDMMLASAKRQARAEGFLDLPSERIAKEDDARPLYQEAARKYADGRDLLNNDFSRQVKAPAPHVVKYLDAIAAAGRRPKCSPVKIDWDGRYNGVTELRVLSTAAKALAMRARDEADLRATAAVVHHLGTQTTVLATAYWSELVGRTLDKASALKLSPESRRRLCQTLGPPLEPRETMRRHVAATMDRYERTVEKEGESVSRTRREGAYLRFWRDFFAKAPDDAAFVRALVDRDSDVATAELQASDYVDFHGNLGPAWLAKPWGKWATSLRDANARLAAGR